MAGLLEEQKAFYRENAGPSDRWLSTLMDEGNDEDAARTHRAGRRLIEDHLATVGSLGQVLEIAAGTGRLAEVYLPYADAALLVDSSPESLALAERRLRPSATVDLVLVEADIFDWDAGARTFDTIVFSAWLHHVPASRFDGFWATVEGLLAPGGTVVFDFLDAHVPAPGGRDIPPVASEDYAFYAPVDGVSTRDLGGRRWHVVHERWRPEDLSAHLGARGWEVTVLGPGLLVDLVWATAERRAPGNPLAGPGRPECTARPCSP